MAPAGCQAVPALPEMKTPPPECRTRGRSWYHLHLPRRLRPHWRFNGPHRLAYKPSKGSSCAGSLLIERSAGVDFSVEPASLHYRWLSARNCAYLTPGRPICIIIPTRPAESQRKQVFWKVFWQNSGRINIGMIWSGSPRGWGRLTFCVPAVESKSAGNFSDFLWGKR